MTIERLTSLTVKVTLNESELNCFGLNYETLKNNDINTGKMISCILNEVKYALNTDLHNDPLFIEAFSDKYGNCILYISSEKSNMSSVSNRSLDDHSTVSVYSETEIPVINLANEISEKITSLKSSLYFTNSRYFLNLYVIKKSVLNELKKIIKRNRLSFFTDNIVSASSEEYGICLIEKDAVEILSGRKSF